jgi:hypothetical protein
MILATIELPTGSRLHLGEDRRWTGDDALDVAMANAYQPTGNYHPQWPTGLANEVAEYLGGKVLFIIPVPKPDAPPGAVY